MDTPVRLRDPVRVFVLPVGIVGVNPVLHRGDKNDIVRLFRPRAFIENLKIGFYQWLRVDLALHI
jgi:hypothetical protein